MTVKLLTEHHLEFLTLKGGYTGSSESTLVKMPHCWKSHVVAHIRINHACELDIVNPSISITDFITQQASRCQAVILGTNFSIPITLYSYNLIHVK